MADVLQLLADAMEAPAVPSDPDDLVEYAGGKRALTQALSGLDHSPRRKEYPDGARGDAAYKRDYTKWRTASRRAQRGTGEGREGKQRRGTKEGSRLTEEQKRTLRERATERKVDEITKNGLRARMYAKMRRGSPGKKGEPARWREIPAGGPGVFISASDADDILAEILLEGNEEAAAEFFTQDILANYFGQGAEDQWEVEEVQWLKIWPEGEPEP